VDCGTPASLLAEPDPEYDAESLGPASPSPSWKRRENFSSRCGPFAFRYGRDNNTLTLTRRRSPPAFTGTADRPGRLDADYFRHARDFYRAATRLLSERRAIGIAVLQLSATGVAASNAELTVLRGAFYFKAPQQIEQDRRWRCAVSNSWDGTASGSRSTRTRIAARIPSLREHFSRPQPLGPR